jgi:aspartyl-tRNA(Asn)/glutamyl-tRNA(Gln) amidotransferase subunit A
LESNGTVYQEISLPHTKYALASYYIIAMAEASTNLAKFCGMRYGLQEELKGNFEEYFSTVRKIGFGQEAKRRIILGTYARMAGFRDAYYLKALKVRTKVIEDFKIAFKNFDVLAAPTMPVIAPRFDEIEKLQPIEQYMMDVLTVGPNLAGIPMISVPAGLVNKMPVGLHLMGDHLQEGKILRAAHVFEQVKK